jgi:two-component system cell cycle response regulator
MSAKILTVDDSKTVRMIVAKAFQPFDCVILEGGDGVEGLAVAAKEKPDIIILDITMPVMDGYETLTKLKSDPELKGIPVIMLTAEAGKENVTRIAKLGVSGYLIKPFKEDVIVERVNRVVPLKLKGEASGEKKKVDDPLGILVVDDKPAILEQVRAGFADSPWKIVTAANSDEAMAACGKSPVDVALISLSLADDAAFSLLEKLRSSPRTKSIPVVGLSVKTAVEVHERAQQGGFAGIITKPIDYAELKIKVCRILSLDTSAQYFRQQNGALVVAVPAVFDQNVSGAISSGLARQTSNAVDEGVDKLIVDLSKLQTANIAVIKLVMEILETCGAVGLRPGLIGSDAVIAECKKFEETQNFAFSSTFEEAVAALVS